MFSANIQSYILKNKINKKHTILHIAKNNQMYMY